MNKRKTQFLVVLGLAFLLIFGCGSPADKKQAFYKKGKALMEDKDYVKAKLELKNAVQIDPEFADAYFLLGKIALEEKDFQSAFKMFRQTETLDPANLEAVVAIGRMLLGAKAFDRAKDKALYVLEEDPKHVEARLLLASIHLAGKQFQEADTLLADIKAEGHTPPQLYIMMAYAYKQKQDIAGVKQILKEGVSKNPDNISLLIRLAQVTTMEKDYSQAEGYIQKMISLKPDAISHKLNLAGLYLVQKQIQKAQDYLDEVIAQSDNEEAVILSVAKFWLKSQLKDKTIALLENAMAQEPENFEYRFFLSQVYLNDKAMDKAETLLRETLTLNPDPGHPGIVKTKLGLSKVLAARSELEAAEILVDEVLAEDPSNLDAHDMKGRFYLNKKDGFNATSEFRIIVEENPENVQAYLNLAQSHILNKEKELALDVLEKGHKQVPKSEKILMALVRFQMADKNEAAGLDYLNKIIEINPENMTARVVLGDYYARNKAWDKAIANYKSAKKFQDKNPIGHIKLSYLYLKLNRDQEAYSELIQGYEQYPDSAVILSRLAQYFLDHDKVDNAIALCNARLDKAPDESFTWNLLGGIYLSQKKFDLSQSAFEKAIEITPDWTKPYDNLAKLYLVQGKKDQAVKNLETILEKNDKTRSAWLLLGSIYERDKNYQKAATVYKRAFDAIPTLWTAANNYAYIKAEYLSSEEDLDEALSYAQKAMDLNKKAMAVRDTLGWIAYKQGNLDQAYHEIKTALDEQPENHILNYHMGMILEKQGKHLEAVSYFETALAQNQEFSGADTARKLVNE